MLDKRQKMIDVIRDKYGLDSPRVFSAMAAVDRKKFAPDKSKRIAYENRALGIGYGQTMSQPYTVAIMTHLLELSGNEKVLEIGTGSGYQAAVLSELSKEVYTVEIVTELAKRAKKILKSLGINNVHIKKGSGDSGWKTHAPYNAIIITAGLRKVPGALFDQLIKGGVLVAPIGKGMDKQMTKFTKSKSGGIKRKKYGVFHFVPFVSK